MPHSITEANNILDYTFRGKSLSSISELWIGLSTNDPVADGGEFNELSGNGYARVLVEQFGKSYPALLGAAADRSITNVKQINWTKATGGDWQRAKGIGFFTSPTGGTPRFYGKLTLTAEQIAAGGLLTEEGAVCLLDPGAFRVEMADYDLDIE